MSMYLTNEMYGRVLAKIHQTVNAPDFKPRGQDCTDIGAKSTTTNCGMCNDEFTTQDSAMWPDMFPKRKTSKYPLSQHICPFDRRTDADGRGGCFYKCYVFWAEHKHNVDYMRQLVQERIDIARKELNILVEV